MKNNRFISFFKWLFISITSLFVAAVMIFTSVFLVTCYSNRISTENGIDEGIYVPICGQEQYLLIRGEDKNNPVIIWLHGGPSSPDAFASYSFQKYLVDKYTFVNWDQRGCGRTYYRNKETDPKNETVSFEQAQSDLDELVNYVTERFGKEKVVIIGHSYGTMLGSKYTLDNPDKVSAYIGVGQFVNISSEDYSYNDALEIAKNNGDDITKLQESYKAYTENKTLLNMMQLRMKVSEYHPVPKEADPIMTGMMSPYMNFDDLRWFLKQMGDFEDYINYNKQLFDYILVGDVTSYGTEYKVPAGFISGSCDWVTPVKYSEDYYNAISAPIKDIALIDGCGHSPFYDDPVGFTNALEEMLDDMLNKKD